MKDWQLKIKTWWQQLAVREQKAIAIGGVCLTLVILYAGIWSPFLTAIAREREHIVTNQKLLVWMQNADKEIRRKSTQNQDKQKTISPVVLLSVLQKQINSAGLNKSLTLLKESSTDAIQLQMQKVAFDQFMTMIIALMKTYPITVAQLSVIAEDTPGLVNVDLVVKVVASS